MNDGTWLALGAAGAIALASRARGIGSRALDLDALLAQVQAEHQAKLPAPRSRVSTIDLTEWANLAFDEFGGGYKGATRAGFLMGATAKQAYDRAVDVAYTVGAHARRLGMSKDQMRRWLQTAYGGVWVKRSHLNPGADLKQVQAAMEKGWSMAAGKGIGSRALDLDALLAQVQGQVAPDEVQRANFTRLQNTEGTHNKFWEGWTEGSTFYARWGRIGSTPSTGDWPLASPQAALKRLQAKAREKRNKGYVVISSQRPAQQSRPRTQALGQPQILSVMLAKTWKGDTDPTGWHMSEKLDGMRAYWTGTRMLSRNGNPIAIPDWLEILLPPTPLDGELWLGRGRFQDLVSVARKNTPRDPRWTDVQYLVFDAPQTPGGCEERFAALRKTVQTACRKWKRKGPCPLVFVEQTVCRSRADLQRFHRQITALGGEGAMIRAPGSPYSRSRTSELLKVVTSIRDEAEITGHTEGTGRNRGRLGAYQARLLDSGTAFKVGTGISDDERDNPLPLGTIITVEYKEKTNAGVPRHPRLIGPRNYE